MSVRRTRILLTNDDSHDSPLLHVAIDVLRSLGELDIVVPATEQSWKSKSMTRHGAVHAERTEIRGVPAWSVAGTPADCVNLAVYNLLSERPDLVVSGINLGRNVGLGFVYSSGTVGACLEANIAGLPGLALSQDMKREDFIYWQRHRSLPPDVTASLQRSLMALVPRVWDVCMEGHSTERTTWNVNFPAEPNGRLELRRTRLGLSTYGRCFEPSGDHYQFGLVRTDFDPHEDTDDSTIKAGHVSMTLLDIRTLGQRV